MVFTVPSVGSSPRSFSARLRNGVSLGVKAGMYFQFAEPSNRTLIFNGIKKTLKPGGLLLLEGYRPEQVDYGTGGPPQREHMYTEELLREAFGDFDIELLEGYDAEVDEGAGHSGISALIDLVARKPA